MELVASDHDLDLLECLACLLFDAAVVVLLGTSQSQHTGVTMQQMDTGVVCSL